MISFTEALRIANEVVKDYEARIGTDLELILEETIEKDYGWVFGYQSAAFMRTKEDRHALMGNAPFLVRKADGKVILLGTGRSIEWYLKQYKKGNWPREPFKRWRAK